MSPKLSIIIVNWNGINFLPNCLKSIVENRPGVPFEIVVVDNESGDRSLEWMKSPAAKETLNGVPFTLIESGENLGFGRGNNLAMQRTLAPYVLLLNPDTIVKDNAIDRLLESLQGNDQVGMTAPRLLNEDGTLQPSVWVHPPTPPLILAEGLGLYRFIPKRLRAKWFRSRHWNHDEKIVVPAVSGAAMMIKRKMTNAIGLFNSDIHMYGEDAELCVRIKKSGWKILFVPDAEVTHLGGQSSVQRWGISETRIKETEAFIEFQNRCVWPVLVTLNTLTSAFVLSLYVVREKIKNNDTTLLIRLIRLQITGCRKSIARIFETGDV